MADNLHKTMAMDDKFTALALKAQIAIDKLVSLAADMHDANHKPTNGQKAMINSLMAEVKHLVDTL
jgi:hypothetical protein